MHKEYWAPKRAKGMVFKWKRDEGDSRTEREVTGERTTLIDGEMKDKPIKSPVQ